jgi:2-dehydropantoate 2-reductase
VAGIRYASADEISERVAGNEELRSIEGEPRGGGSTWQSLARGGTGIETAYLNGEVVLLGRLQGVPTPVNQAITNIALRMAREGEQAGSVEPLQVQHTIEQLRT